MKPCMTGKYNGTLSKLWLSLESPCKRVINSVVTIIRISLSPLPPYQGLNHWLGIRKYGPYLDKKHQTIVMCLDILNGEFIEINHPSLANIHFHGKFDSFPVVYSIPFWSFKDNIGYTITLPLPPWPAVSNDGLGIGPESASILGDVAASGRSTFYSDRHTGTRGPWQ